MSLKTVSQSPESHQNTFEDNNKQAEVCMIYFLQSHQTKPKPKTNRNVNETKLTFDFEESNENN